MNNIQNYVTVANKCGALRLTFKSQAQLFFILERYFYRNILVTIQEEIQIYVTSHFVRSVVFFLNEDIKLTSMVK